MRIDFSLELACYSGLGVDVCHRADGFADNAFDFAGYALGVVDYFCLHRVQFACAKFIEHLVDKGQRWLPLYTCP